MSVAVVEGQEVFTLEDISRYDASVALANHPYFAFNGLENEAVYKNELLEIQTYYNIYKKGANIVTEGSLGDYVPTKDKYKIIKTLIDKEARFMFSQTPDIFIQSEGTEEADKREEQNYQRLINEVLRKSKFSNKLLKGAKDCFIGKRIAVLVDFSERVGIKVRFFNSKSFYFDMDEDTEELRKFVGVELLVKHTDSTKRRWLVTKYEVEDDSVYLTQTKHDGAGQLIETLIDGERTFLDEIPVVVILNDGTLDETNGVSEIYDLYQLESTYSFASDSDVDSLRKGMNPIRYAIDMNHRTTENLSSSAGSFWDLEHNQNMDDAKPSVGVLAPSLEHSEPLKTTLDRIKSTMYGIIDMPDISAETMAGTITSGKGIKVLYYPLSVRCNEKLIEWKPAIEKIVRLIIDLALLNDDEVISLYQLEGLKYMQYKVHVSENYALMDDETEEKETDLAEINTNTRSRFSYIKKWRSDEFANDEQIEQELIRIAQEQNMFDNAGMNPTVQQRQEDEELEAEINSNLENIETQNRIEQNEISEQKV